MKRIAKRGNGERNKAAGSIKGRPQGALPLPPQSAAKAPTGDAKGNGKLAKFARRAKPERREARPGKLYLSRLEDQDLPLERVARKATQPDQLQLASLAALLTKNGGTAPSATELVNQALELWNAAGAALWAKEQVLLLCRGLLYFSQEDWAVQANDLIRAMNDGQHAPDGMSDLNGVNEYTTATRRAALAVKSDWELFGASNEDVLKALFPGKAETERTRTEKFMGLVAYTSAVLKGVTALNGLAVYQEGTDVLRQLIRTAWDPLGFREASSLEYVVDDTRERLKEPMKLLEAEALVFYPEVTRMFVIMRQRQLVEAMTRV
jgi:hypothetical protein